MNDQNQIKKSVGLSFQQSALWLITLSVLYALCMVSSWNLGHLDFGDGNYMYISWRIANGAVLYRDILAPQPPVHFGIGFVLAKIGAFFHHPIYAFRAYSLILHIVTMALVYACTVRISVAGKEETKERWRSAGILAAILYLLIPIGFWWSAGYQSEPTEMGLMLGAFYLTTLFTPLGVFFAGVLMGLAVLTNMTAAPYAMFIAVGLLIRQWRLGSCYLLGLLPVVAIVLGAAEALTGACIENVFLNQVGSYPRPELLPQGTTVWGYFINKLVNEGQDILRLDGGFILIGLLGVFTFAFKKTVPGHIREFVVLFVFCAILSFIYVTKGGTVDYIFTIGEPFVAMMGGWFLCNLWHFIRQSGEFPKTKWADWTVFGISGAVVLIGLVVYFPGFLHSVATLRQKNYEADEFRTMQIVREIKAATPEDGMILAPPHYAFIAQRKIALDYSELLLWTLKYLNEKIDRQNGKAMQTVGKLSEMIRKKEIAFIALDMNQTAKIPEIKQAIDANYEKTRETPFVTLNTSLQFYMPKKN